MRPLTLGEILDRTVQLYRRNFLIFLGISVLPAAVDVLLSGGFGSFMASKMAGIVPGVAGKTPDLKSYLVLGVAGAAFLLIGVPTLLGVFSLALSALNYAALALNRGEAVTIRASYRFALRHFWRNVGVLSMQFLLAAVTPGVVLGGLFMVVGISGALLIPKGSPAAAILFGLVFLAMMLIVAGACIWIWIRFCLAFPATVAEDKRVWPSMKRSAQLTKGTRGRIFVMYLMVGILTIVVYYALIIPADLALGVRVDKLFAITNPPGLMPIVVQCVNLFITFLERAFVMPIYAVALVLFYADQRTRLEGYDIEQLMAQAGWSDLTPTPAQTPIPAPIQVSATELNTPQALEPDSFLPTPEAGL